MDQWRSNRAGNREELWGVIKALSAAQVLYDMLGSVLRVVPTVLP